ncbi:MAG: hypothetical protein JWM36_1803 [Hyphomicrobiales bacterium]|nr:hypothetical protein [Hyphomicrobiales bacterium]
MSYVRWHKLSLGEHAPFFWRDRSGSVAVITALCMLIVLGFVSLALDFGLSQAARAKLDSAADAASLRAARTTVDRMNHQTQYGTYDWSAAQADGVGTGKAAFAANAGKLFGVEIPTPTITVTNDNGAVKASVAWSTQASLTLGRALGWSSIKMAGESVASASLPKYYQFIFLVDVSNSMGIGGTDSAIDALYNDPQIKCSFACHDPNHVRETIDYRELARQKSIKLKIDYVSDAVKMFTDEIARRNASAAIPKLYSVGIYTFGTGYNQVLAPTTNIASAASAAQNVDIEAALPIANFGYSYLNDALDSLSSDLRNIGTGTSTTARKTYVILLTDGIQDVPGPGLPGGRKTDVVDYRGGCASIKAKGAEIVSILAPIPQMKYDPYWYNKLVKPLATDIAPALKSCASDPTRDFFEAVDGPDISAAVTTMMNQALPPLSLTR